jgi:MFS family permease
METVGNVERSQRTRASWPPYRTMWFWLLLGWTVSAADRAMTGPVVTWMIGNHVGFLADASKPYALGGLVGGLFFAGYMLTQWPGGYLGDRYGHRTLISVSLIWAGIATLLSGLLTGLVVFIAIRVLTGLGEGAFYSNDRSMIAEKTPVQERSLGMGVVITGLAFGITIATDIADPTHHGAAFGLNNLIGETGAVLSPAVSGVLRDATGAWSAAVFVDAGLIAAAVLLLLCVREGAVSRVLNRAPAPDAESRLGPRMQPSRRTVV